MHGVTIVMTTSRTNGVGARRVVVIEVTTGGIFQKGSGGAHAQGWLVGLNDIWGTRQGLPGPPQPPGDLEGLRMGWEVAWEMGYLGGQQRILCQMG